jgi:hypothetical protein
VAERSKALDWNSSNIFTGVRGFESHPLRQLTVVLTPTQMSSPASDGWDESAAAWLVERVELPIAARSRSIRSRSTVIRAGTFATINREPRQARKGATVTAQSGAEVHAGTDHLPEI